MMIKETDLRVGIWLNHNASWCYKSPSEIKPFKFQWTASDWYAVGECTMSLDDIEPIELTPEILEKSGYSWVNEAGGYADKKHFIDEWKVNDNHYFLFSPFCTNDKDCQLKVHSLHQLQNIIYSFTGIELEVVW